MWEHPGRWRTRRSRDSWWRRSSGCRRAPTRVLSGCAGDGPMLPGVSRSCRRWDCAAVTRRAASARCPTLASVATRRSGAARTSFRRRSWTPRRTSCGSRGRAARAQRFRRRRAASSRRRVRLPRPSRSRAARSSTAPYWRSAELERRLEALQSEAKAASDSEAPSAAPTGFDPPESSAAAPVSSARAEPSAAPLLAPAVAAPAVDPAAGALAEAVATVKRLRRELGEQRQRVRKSELLRAADAVALATVRAEEGRAADLERRLADAVAARDQAADQVAFAQRRAAADAEAVRAKTADE